MNRRFQRADCEARIDVTGNTTTTDIIVVNDGAIRTCKKEETAISETSIAGSRTR